MKYAGESGKRSIVKAITYRVIIITLDFIVVYLFTKKTSVAGGFVIISNIYTTVGYVLHERLWARVHWGRVELSRDDQAV